MSRLAGDGIIYLDYNATAPLSPEVQAAVCELIAAGMPMNPSSSHSLGRGSRQMVERARKSVCTALGLELGMRSARVVFCGSGTEANNLALKGWPADSVAVMVSATEHASVLKSPVISRKIPVQANGLIDLDTLGRLLEEEKQSWGTNPHPHTGKRLLVSVMLANSETGVIQPIAAIADLVHRHGGIMHTDASQALGKIPVSFPELGVDLLTFSGHKFGAPLGVGVLVAKTELALLPLLDGGGQEGGLRSGTLNTPAIHGLGVAMGQLADHLRAMEALHPLRQMMEAELSCAGPGVVISGSAAPRLPNTSSIRMPGVRSETQIAHFDSCGICVSAGSACSAGVVSEPHVQLAMGYEEAVAREFIRVSMGPHQTKSDVDAFLHSWFILYRKTRVDLNALS